MSTRTRIPIAAPSEGPTPTAKRSVARRFALLVAALSLSAAVPLGCSSLLGPDAPDVTVSLHPETDLEGIAAFEVTLGSRTVRVDAGSTNVSQTVSAPGVGTFRTRAALLGTADDTLTATEFDQRFQENYDHWVSARLGQQRPFGHCIGTLSVHPLPATAPETPPDTLFLTHGGIPRDAVC